jgi:putative ABC transport system substrate-binding protein
VRRRKFITLLGGAAAWPLSARAQQRERVRRVGLLMGLAESDPETAGYVEQLKRGLQSLGWSQGHNVEFVYR